MRLASALPQRMRAVEQEMTFARPPWRSIKETSGKNIRLARRLEESGRATHTWYFVLVNHFVVDQSEEYPDKWDLNLLYKDRV